ncbi:hypothetical protein CLU79DRAFT_838087 [Phycomyces nitens]|nr:hypothetical protein CLU79DRAFT_838087 [Phycomyces nitens]
MIDPPYMPISSEKPTMLQTDHGSNPTTFSEGTHTQFESNPSATMGTNPSLSFANSYSSNHHTQPLPNLHFTEPIVTEPKPEHHSEPLETRQEVPNDTIDQSPKIQAGVYDSMGLTGVFSMTDRSLVDRIAESTNLDANDTSSAPQPTNEVVDWTNDYSSSIDLNPRSKPDSTATGLKPSVSPSSKSSSPLPHFNFTPNIRLDTPTDSRPAQPTPPQSITLKSSLNQPKLSFKKQIHMMKQYEERGIPARQIVRESNIDLRTFYRVLRKFHKRGYILNPHRRLVRKNKNRRKEYKLTDRELRQLKRIEVREPRKNTYRQLAKQMSVITGQKLSPNYIERCLRSMGLRGPTLLERPYRRQAMQRHIKRRNRSVHF